MASSGPAECLFPTPYMINATIKRSNEVKSSEISLFIITAFVLISNLMLIHGFHKTSRPFTKVTKLFILLSVFDMMSCIGSFLLVVVSLIGPNFPCIVFIIIFAFDNFNFYFVVMIFATICTLRFVAFKRPFKRINNWTVYGALIIEFMISLAFAVATYLLFRESNLRLMAYATLIAISALTCLVIGVFIINILSYVHLSRSINRKKKINNASVELDNPSSTTSNCQQHQGDISQGESDERKREAVKTLIIITLFYTLCYLPLIIYDILVAYWLNTGKHFDFESMYYTPALTNGGLNSLIYILRNKNIRQFYNKKFESVFKQARRT